MNRVAANFEISFACLLMMLCGAAGPASGQVSAIGDRIIHQDTPGIPGGAEPDDLFGAAMAAGDFDGDGNIDLAVGAPLEGISGMDDAGVVVVVYSAPGGPVPENSQLWHQDVAGILDSAEPGDHFGGELAVGDFDNDGYDDLAISVPTESIGIADWFQAGAVQVLYGTAQGLSDVGDQLWHQDIPGILDDAQPLEIFGGALAVGDFDNDNYDDLAIGVHGDVVNSLQNAGAVHVLYGGAPGLAVSGNQLWTQATPGIANSAEGFDSFGSALATGDFDNDGFDDLAIGVESESLILNTINNAGAAHVIYGTPNGLDATGDQFWTQNSGGILDSAEANDFFGRSLAAGDFDNDGFDDLSIGVPSEEVDGQSDAGAFHVIFGSSNGLDSNGNQFLHQNSAGVPGNAEPDDALAGALAAGDFNNDGFADLAVSVSGEDIETVVDAGAAHVFHGGPFGFVGTPIQLWHQGITSVVGAVEANDFFGAPVAGDLDGDGADDLIVGIPGEGIGELDDAGAIQIFFTSGIFEDGFESGDTSAWTGQSP